MATFQIDGNSGEVDLNHARGIESDTIPSGTYELRAQMGRGLYLAPHAEYKMPPKLYGDTVLMGDRIINTYSDRRTKHNANTGILLRGEKGSGKTLQAHEVARKAVHENGWIVIYVNSPFGDALAAFLKNITQPTVLMFDEFEKRFDNDQQNALLTLLDGADAGYPKLYMFVVNEKDQVNRYMLGRPGRIWYDIEYAGLSQQFVREYCVDCLHNFNGRIGGILNVTQSAPNFTFDQLKALVEECNRYPDLSVTSIMKVINIESYSYNTHMILVHTDDVVRDKDGIFTLKKRDGGEQQRVKYLSSSENHDRTKSPLIGILNNQLPEVTVTYYPVIVENEEPDEHENETLVLDIEGHTFDEKSSVYSFQTQFEGVFVSFEPLYKGSATIAYDND